MSNTIILNGIEVEITSDAARAFISDACRAGESVIDDATLMEKYDLTPEDLQKLANNKSIGRLILREREHRLRTGISTRELASKGQIERRPLCSEVRAGPLCLRYSPSKRTFEIGRFVPVDGATASAIGELSPISEPIPDLDKAARNSDGFWSILRATPDRF